MAFDPIVFLISYSPATPTVPVPSLFGIQLDFAGNATVIDLSGATWAGNLGVFTGAGPIVSAIQYSNSIVFALGLNVSPQLFKFDGTFAPIVNTFQSTTNYPPWLLSTQYPKGVHIIAASGTQTYIFKAINGGTSGASAPAWPATMGRRVTLPALHSSSII
jgi:hypothetical protein